MKSYTLAVGAPTTFSLTATDPNFYTENLSHELHTLLYGLTSQGFVVTQREDADLTAMVSEVNSVVSAFDTWVDAQVAFAAAGDDESLTAFDPALITSIITAIAGIASGGSGLILAVCLELAIRVAVKWLEAQFTSNPSNDVAKALHALLKHENELAQDETITEMLARSFMVPRVEGEPALQGINEVLGKALNSQQPDSSWRSFADLFTDSLLVEKTGGGWESILAKLLADWRIKIEPVGGNLIMSFGAFEEEEL